MTRYFQPSTRDQLEKIRVDTNQKLESLMIDVENAKIILEEDAIIHRQELRWNCF